MSAVDDYRQYLRHAGAAQNYGTKQGLALSADAAIAELEAEVERLKKSIGQAQMYRLPVLGLNAETGDQGIFWINGLNAAEVFAALHDDPLTPVYESLPGSAVICWRERAWVMGP